jgi:hypothetical protein
MINFIKNKLFAMVMLLLSFSAGAQTLPDFCLAKDEQKLPACTAQQRDVVEGFRLQFQTQFMTQLQNINNFMDPKNKVLYDKANNACTLFISENPNLNCVGSYKDQETGKIYKVSANDCYIKPSCELIRTLRSSFDMIKSIDSKK